MELASLDLKFLLRLLENLPDYRTRISKLKLEPKTPTSERNRICESLCSQGFVAYVEDIQRYQTEVAGKTLLTSDTTLPLSSDELTLLQVAATKAATPGQANKVPASDRQRLLRQLKERGLISVTKSQIGDVWLTPQGVHYLLYECTPTSPHAKVSFSMLGHYLTFLRQTWRQTDLERNGLQRKNAGLGETVAKTTNAVNLSSKEVLETIRRLDQQLDTDNFLPIFHLRKKLQPPLSRETLDQFLYELQSQDLIEFSTLQEVSNYSESEAAAGIPQNIGGALFYISVTE